MYFLYTRYIEVTTTLENIETKEEFVYDAAVETHALGKSNRRAREEQERRKRVQDEKLRHERELDDKRRRWEKETQQLEEEAKRKKEEERPRREAEQNGWNGGKPFLQTDLDAVMVMSDQDDSIKTPSAVPPGVAGTHGQIMPPGSTEAGNISASLENGMHGTIGSEKDGVMLPNLPPITKPDESTNTFPDANKDEPFNTSKAPAEMNISINGADPEVFTPSSSVTAPYLNGTLQLQDKNGVTDPDLSGSDGSLSPKVLSKAVSLISDKLDTALESSTISDLDMEGEQLPTESKKDIPNSVSFSLSQDDPLEVLREKNGTDPISDSGYGEGTLGDGGQTATQDASRSYLGSPDKTEITPGGEANTYHDTVGLLGDEEQQPTIGLHDEKDKSRADPNKYTGEIQPANQVKSDIDSPSFRRTSLDVSDGPIDNKGDSTDNLPLKTPPKIPEHRYPMFVAMDDGNKGKGSLRGSNRSSPSKSPAKEGKRSLGRSSPAKEKVGKRTAETVQPCVVSTKTVQDGSKSATVIRTEVTTEDGAQKGTLPTESSNPGSVTTKTIKTGNKTTTIFTQIERCDKQPDDIKKAKLDTQEIGVHSSETLTDEDWKPGIVSSKLIKDGDKATKVTVTLIKTPEGPNKDDKKLLYQTIDGICNLESLPKENAKPCTITTKKVEAGNKTTTTTTTVVSSQDGPTEAKSVLIQNAPCTVTLKTVKDGKRESLITTTLVMSQDPDDFRHLDSMETAPAMADGKPGTMSRETIKDGDERITVTTTRVTTEETASKKKNKGKNKDKKPVSDSKPGIVATMKVKDGNKPAILTTTLVPIQGTPKRYETNILDLMKLDFPGFNTVSEDQVHPCTVTVETIPEGNKTTTITKVTSKEVPISEAGREGLPCTVATKTVKDGKKESLITTTLLISQDKADSKQLESIPDGFPIMDDPKSGTFTSETITDDGKTIRVNTTKMSEETPRKKGFKGLRGFKNSKDKKSVSDTRPGIIAIKKVRDGNKVGTVITTVAPLQGMPKDYGDNMLQLQHTSFPGFNAVEADEGKPCIVNTETVHDGGKTTTMIITKTYEDKPLPIAIPGFGNVPAEDTKLCIIAAKTIKDGNNATLVTTTVTASRDTQGSNQGIPLELKDIDISGFIETPENSKPGIFAAKTVEDTDRTTTVTATLITCDDGKCAYLIPNDMPKGQEKPAITTTKSIQDGDIITTVTTTMVPIQDLPADYKFTTGDLKETKFPGFEEMPVEDTKPCTVAIETIPEGNKMTTVTITRMLPTTLIPTEEQQTIKPLVLEIPGFGDVPTEDTKPCIVTTKTISDGYNTTLVTTNIMASQDIPGKDTSIPLGWKDIDISGLVDTPEDSSPGICVVKTIEETKKPITVTATLVTSDSDKPGYPIPDDMPKGQEKPAITTTKSIQDGDIITTVTTTMVPIQDLPADYKFTTGDLKETKFPGFEEMPVEDTKPCTVAIETIPEGNKMTTVTITRMLPTTLIPTEEQQTIKPLVLEIPGFGDVPTEDTKPCIVTTKTISDGYNTTLVTTNIMASQDIPGKDTSIPLGWKDIDISGLVDTPEDSSPGICVVKTIEETKKPITVTATLVTSDSDKPGYPIPDDMPKGQEKPAITTTKSIQDGDIITTVTTTMVPIQDLPADYKFTTGDLKETKFPGFEEMPVEDTKPCTVAIETIPEGNKMTTVTITRMLPTTLIPTEEQQTIKPLVLEIPGFGDVPTEDTKPCIVTTKTISDGYNTTLVTTNIMASQDIPGKDTSIPLGWKDIDISGLVDTPEDSSPGICVVKTIEETKKPITVTATLVTSDSDKPGYPIPDDMPKGQEKPAITTTKSIQDGDIITTVTTTMVPIQDLPADYKFTTGDLKETRFPGFEEMPVEDTKPCTVAIETIPEGNKMTTVTITRLPAHDKMIMSHLPGFGTVPTEETEPSGVAAKTAEDGDKATLMSTTVMASQDILGTDDIFPLAAHEEDTSNLIDTPEKSNPYKITFKKYDDADESMKINASLILSEDILGSPSHKDIPIGEAKPGIISSRKINDGNTTTSVHSKGIPEGNDSNMSQQEDQGFPGFNNISPEDEAAKPSTFSTNFVKEGSNTSTVTVTEEQGISKMNDTSPYIQDKTDEASKNLEVMLIDNEPCKVTTKTVKDGKKECLITTTLVISEDPDDIRNLDKMETDVPPMPDGKPGTFSREVIEDDEERITVTTTKVTTKEALSKKKGKDKEREPVSNTRSGVITTRKVQDGNKPMIVTTILVPIHNAPKGNESNIVDLKRSGFPGFNTISEDQMKPCTVTIDTIPEGNIKTTITKVTFKDTQESVFDGLPCAVTTKTVKDGKKESLVITSLVIITEKADKTQLDPIENGFPNMDNAKPATVTSKATTDGDKTRIVNTIRIYEKVQHKSSKGFKGFESSKDTKPVIDSRPGMSTTQNVKDGSKVAKVTTIIVPLQGMPKDYENDLMELKKTGFPAFDMLKANQGQACVVNTESITDENKKITTITTTTSQEKSQIIEIPGFGSVPGEDAKPCIFTAKTVKDGEKTTMVTTSVMTNQDIPGTNDIIYLQPKDIDISGFIDAPENSKPGTFTTKIVDDAHKPIEVTATVVTSDSNKPAFPIPDDMPSGKGKPGIVTTKSSKDGDKTTTVTTTMVPIQGASYDYKFTAADLKKGRFPGFDSIPNGDTKTCIVTVQNIPQGNKTNTVMTTAIPIQDKPLMIEFPGFGKVIAEDAKPCLISVQTIRDGEKTTMVSTTVIASKAIPCTDETIPLEPQDINLYGLVKNPADLQPGTLVTKTIEDADKPITVTTILVSSSGDELGPLIPDDMPRGQDKPAIITTKSTKDGEITTTVTTTMVPVQDLPDDYRFTVDDLNENRFPGFDTIPNGHTKACIVKVDNIPEGNETTTVTTTTIPTKGVPLIMEIPGFGNVSADNAKPCVVATKMIRDDNNCAFVTTIVTAYQDIPGTDDNIPLDSKDIDISGLVDKPEESRPGLFVEKTIDVADRPIRVTATLITSDDDKPGYRIPDDIPKGQGKPAVVTSKSTKDGGITKTVITAMIPIQDLPKDYKFTKGDLKERRFPSFSDIPNGETNTGIVTIDNIPEGNKTSTILTTMTPTEDKPLMIEFPGLGNVVTDDTMPCIVAAKVIKGGNKMTLVSTTVTASQDIPGATESIPLDSVNIEISGLIDTPEVAKPGIYVIKEIDDTDTPLTVSGTLVTTDDKKLDFAIPNDMPLDQACPAIVTTKFTKDGDMTKTARTIMVPLQDFPDDFRFTSDDLRESKYPGFGSVHDGDTKSCMVTINNIPSGTRTNTVTITTIPSKEKSLIIHSPDFGAVDTEDTQPCAAAVETIKIGEKTTLVSTTVTASEDIPGRDCNIPLGSRVIDISGIVDRPGDSTPSTIAIKTEDGDRPMTVTATMVTTENELGTVGPKDISSDETMKPGIISSKTMKDIDTTTVVTTTLVPIQGISEDNDDAILKLENQGFPGFDIVPLEDEAAKPCTFTTHAVKEGNKTTTVITTETPEVDKRKKLEAITSQYIRNIPRSITFNITQTGICGFDPVPVNDAEPCMITTKRVEDGSKTILLTTTLQELRERDGSDKDYPNFDEICKEDVKPGVVVGKTVTEDNKTISVTSTIVTEDDKGRPVEREGPRIENITQDKPGIIARKTVNINNKPTELTTTIVALNDTAEETVKTVIDPKDTAFSSFYDVPTDSIKPCYVTIKEGKDESKTVTVTTAVVTDQDIQNTGIVLSSDTERDTVESEQLTNDVKTSVPAITTMTTTVPLDEDKFDGDDVKPAEVTVPEVGIENDGGSDISGNRESVRPAKEPAQLITTTTTPVTFPHNDNDIPCVVPQDIPSFRDEVRTDKEGVGDGSGVNDVSITVVEQNESFITGDKVSSSSTLRLRFCIVLGHCLQTAKINNVNTSLFVGVSACSLLLFHLVSIACRIT